MKTRSHVGRAVAAAVLCGLYGSLGGCGGGGGGGGGGALQQEVPLLGTVATGTAQTTVPAGGTTAELAGVARATFPAGAFSADQRVQISAGQQPENLTVFRETTQIFRPGGKLAYDVTLNTGSRPPAAPVDLVVLVQDAFASGVPSGHEVEAFVRVDWQGDIEGLDSFELVPAQYDAGAKTVRVSLPKWAFSDTFTSDHTFAAVVTLAVTPQAVRSAATPRAGRASVSGTVLRRPVKRSIKATSLYGMRLDPLNPERERMHYGVDFYAPTGSDLFATSDGTIEFVGTSATYGKRIVLRHNDGSAVHYAHLQEALVSQGARVHAGDLIGKSDTSGARVTGPHLHFEFVPSGDLAEAHHENKTDPLPHIVDKLDVSPQPVKLAFPGDSATISVTRKNSAGDSLNTPISELTFKTDNPGVATVNASGQVTAVGNGSAIVSVTDPKFEDPETVLVIVGDGLKPPKVDITGTWTGTFSSYDPDIRGGTLTVEFVENKLTGEVTGTATVVARGRTIQGQITGKVSGTKVTVGTAYATIGQVTYEGEISVNNLSAFQGTYAGDDVGTFTLEGHAEPIDDP